MAETLDSPENNNFEYLLKRSREFLKMSDEDLKNLAKSGIEKTKAAEAREIKKIKRKNRIK